MEKLKPLIEIEQLGTGFIKFVDGKPSISEEDRMNAEKSFKYASDKIKCGEYDMVILDEINNMANKLSSYVCSQKGGTPNLPDELKN